MVAPEINISVQLLQPRWKTLLRPYCKTVREACSAALGVKDSEFRIQGKCEMTVVLADDKFIRELNKTYRGKDKTTNVLAFPHRHPVARRRREHRISGDPAQSLRASQDDGNYLGDLVLALKTIEREAKEQKKSFKDHARHLLVHGTLHLLGYDHEHKKDAGIMEALEVNILSTLGVSNPYL